MGALLEIVYAHGLLAFVKVLEVVIVLWPSFGEGLLKGFKLVASLNIPKLIV